MRQSTRAEDFVAQNTYERMYFANVFGDIRERMPLAELANRKFEPAFLGPSFPFRPVLPGKSQPSLRIPFNV